MRLVVIEDHVIIRVGVSHACRTRFGHEVVGEAGTGAEGIALVERHRPEAVVLDLSLPDMCGFSVAERLQRRAPATRILVLSGQVDDGTIMRVEQLGLPGFLDKAACAIEVVGEALGAIERGKTYFSPTFVALRQARRGSGGGFEKVLSRAEQEVLALVGEGMSDGEIGSRMGIAPSTAQTHRSKILQKLRIRGTPKLVAFAIQNGFTRLPSRSPFPA